MYTRAVVLFAAYLQEASLRCRAVELTSRLSTDDFAFAASRGGTAPLGQRPTDLIVGTTRRGHWFALFATAILCRLSRKKIFVGAKAAIGYAANIRGRRDATSYAADWVH